MTTRESRPSDDAATLTLPAREFDAVILDLDGVVTDTREAHAAAWKRLFDAWREERAARGEETFAPFDPDGDYAKHVDGKPRYDGVADFLASRGIELPRGDPSDPPDAETVCGLGNRKNRYFHQWLEDHAVRPFPDAVAFVKAARAAGMRTAVFSSSKNAAAVLKSADLATLFDERVDGVTAEEEGLAGKPDPAILVEAASRLGVAPEAAAVVEDAIAGVEAGARGGFALVVGVDRSGPEGHGHGEALRGSGAHVVVHDLKQLIEDGEAALRLIDTVPSLADREREFEARIAGKRLAVFLDYDGTLTPIVADYRAATLSDAMRRAVDALAAVAPVAVISGRDLADVRERVGLDGVYYAGSHGFDIAGPEGWRETQQKGRAFLPALDAAEEALRARLGGIEGAHVERKTFSIAVHHRQAAAGAVEEIERAVDETLRRHEGLRKSHGKKVFQVQPKTDWDKGHAVLWLLDRLGLDRADVLPLAVGDDVTDEDAFRALHRRGNGLAIVVRGEGRRGTAADYAVPDTDAVRDLLTRLARHQRESAA